MKKKSLPEGRSLLIDYFGKSSYQLPEGTVKIKHDDDPVLGRASVQAPVGHDQTPIPIYTFHYEVNSKKKDEQIELLDGSANVYDAFQHKTKYNWNDKRRLDVVEKFSGRGPHQLYCREKLFWGGTYGSQLISRTFENSLGHVQFCSGLDYDDRGNVKSETLCGNLSGWNSVAVNLQDDKKPAKNGCETYVKVYQYHDNHRNLMKSEAEGPNQTYYTYKRDTNLLESKLAGDYQETHVREFYFYDDNGTLVRRIEDDGSSADANCLDNVTIRKIRVIVPRKQIPIGLPEIVEEKYLDLETGEEMLLEWIAHNYSKEGRLLGITAYDKNGQFAYEKHYDYNSGGRPIFEKDVLGRCTHRKFDANFNLTYEKGPGDSPSYDYKYDFSNRLVQKIITGKDGRRISETYGYDLLGNRVVTYDTLGDATRFRFDEFGRCVETTFPDVVDEEGRVVKPSQSVHYNELSHPVVQRDCNGTETRQAFTVRGAPYRTTFADGSEEALYL